MYSRCALCCGLTVMHWMNYISHLTSGYFRLPLEDKRVQSTSLLYTHFNQKPFWVFVPYYAIIGKENVYFHSEFPPFIIFLCLFAL